MIGYPHVWAGSQIQLLSLVKILPDDYRPHFLLTQEGIVSEKLREAGQQVHILLPGKGLNTFGKQILHFPWWKKMTLAIRDYPAFTLKVIRLIRKENIRLIHANDPRSVILLGGAKKWTGIPMVAQLHSQNAIGPNFWSLFEKIPQRICPTSQSVERQLSEKAKTKSKVIYPAIAEPAPRPLPQEDPVNYYSLQGKVVFGIFSTIAPFKGYHHLIEAIALLDEDERSKCHIIACGGVPKEFESYAKYLNQLVNKKKVESHISFLGWKNQPHDYLNICDAALMISVDKERLDIDGETMEIASSESFPTIILEAMFLEKTIIATRVAGVPEQIEDGKTGFIIPPSDPIALKNIMSEVIRNRPDTGTSARKTAVKKYSLSQYKEQFLSVYKKLLT